MATRKAAARKSSAVKTVTLADIQEKFGSRKGARITASSAQKKYDAKWDKFEKKTLKKVGGDIKKTIKEMKSMTF